MDAWTKTVVAIRVLTAAKKRRKKRLDEDKIRIFNKIAGKISADKPAEERIIMLKRKLGKTCRINVGVKSIFNNEIQSDYLIMLY